MNLPDFLTSRCKDPVRPAKWGKVWLVHHPEQICQVLRRPLSLSKGGELWGAVRRLLGKSSLIAMENRAPEDFSRWSEAREKAQKLLSGVPAALRRSSTCFDAHDRVPDVRKIT